MRLGFTGTQNGLTTAQFSLLVEVLNELHEVTEIHHGDCIGADYEFTVICSCIYKDITVVGHPPEDKKKRAFVKSDITHIVRPYLERNKYIVKDSDIMIACPKNQYEELRSGTWSTVRFARKQKRPIVILWPDGKYTYEDGTMPDRTREITDED